MQPNQAYVLEFFAALANFSRLDDEVLPEPAWTLFHESIQVLFPETAEKLRKRILEEHPQTRAQSPPAQAFRAEVEYETFTNLLHAVHFHTRKCILGLLRGDTISLPFVVEPLGRLEGRAMKVLLPIRTDESIQAELLTTLQMRPFPFGQCSQCGQVFVQARRGKPRFFCSSSCKAKAAPSRITYKRQWTQQRRATEVATARRIIRKASSAEKQLELLEKEFPQKTRRQRQNLLKKANHTEEVSQHGRPQ